MTDPDGVSPASVKEMAARLGVSGTEEEGFTSGPAVATSRRRRNQHAEHGERLWHAFDRRRALRGLLHAQILDKDGNVAYDNTNPQGEQVLSPRSPTP